MIDCWLRYFRDVWQPRSGVARGSNRPRHVRRRAPSRRAAQLESLESRYAMDATTLLQRFDFGTAGSPVASGFKQITDRTVYSATAGYGWTAGAIASADRSTGTATTRDFNFTTDGTFAVALPNGRYQVDAVLGDLGIYAHDQVGVYLEGSLRDTVSTLARQIVSRSYQVEVADQQLTVRLKDLGGADRNGVIESLDISSLGPVVPTLTIGDAEVFEGDSGMRTVEFAAQLSAASLQEVSVDFATQDTTAAAGSDYLSAAGTLRIPAGQTQGTISVSVLGDEVVEPNETFALTLSGPVGGVLTRDRATATVKNDDVPLARTLDISPGSFLENHGGVSAIGTLSRNGPTTAALRVDLTNSDASEAAVPLFVEIPVGQTATTFEILAVDDGEVDGPQNVTIGAAAAGYLGGSYRLRVDDNEQPPYLASFDFGTRTSPLATGFTRVSEIATYSTASGFGWSNGRILSADRGGGSTLMRDFIYTTDGTFLADLPNGAYTVDLILGDKGSYSHDLMGVYLEGQLVDTISTVGGQVVSRSFQVNVADRQLTLRLRDLGGRDANATMEALRISGTPAPAGGTAWWPAQSTIVGALFSEPTRDASGFITYTVSSSYQRSDTTIRVLLPGDYDVSRDYQVVYVLPVEPGAASQYGDGLSTVRNLGLQNSKDVIFVAPTFTNMPWYADNVNNSTIWQETYFRTVVVPFVESQYSVVPGADGRLLLGFSKSGYGAMSMLLRYPDTFGRAAIWDSPIGMSDPASGYGFLDILGSRANFSNNYQISSLLVNRGSALKNQPPRIFLLGYSYDFTYQDHRNIDALMTQLGIPHYYDPGVYRSHVWQSGWVGDAVNRLLG